MKRSRASAGPVPSVGATAEPATTCPPLWPRGPLGRACGGLARRRLTATDDLPLAPRGDLGLDVAGHRDQRRSVDGGVAGLHHPGVEVLEQAAHLGLSGVPGEPTVELGVVLAQLEGRREYAADLLPLDQLLDPPVGVVLGTEEHDRLPGAGQVVAVTALHRLLELVVDELV